MAVAFGCGRGAVGTIMLSMLSEVNGLPLHPLVVHAVVVLVPLSLVGLVLLVVRSSWRRALGWWVVLLAGVATASAWLAKESGETLAELVGRPIHHASLGSGLPYFVSAMFVSMLLFVAASAVWDWHIRRAGAKAQVSSGSTAVGTTSPAGRDPQMGSDTDGIEALLAQTSTALGTAPPATASPGNAQVGGDGKAAARATSSTDSGRQRMPLALKVMAGLALLLAVAANVQTFRVGESGAREVWGSTLAAASGTNGSGQDAAAASPGMETANPERPTSATEFTMAQVAQRNQPSDCWTVIDGNVYDLTDWIARHPGGAGVIESLCGVNGTAAFSAQHEGQPQPTTQLDAFVVGVLK